MPRLAVIILTKNEEANIEGAMESAAFADEIVIIDSGSTDRTQELAEKHGAKFVSHPMDDEGFAGQRNFALNQTKAEWVFYLDADERITSSAVNDICEAINGDKAAYRIKRMNVVFGKLMKYGAHRPDWCIRLFPRESVIWKGVVHEKPQFNCLERSLENPLHHHTYNNWSKYFAKLAQYTDMMAVKMYKQGKRGHLSDITLRPLYAFFRAYILQRGFLDGELGLVFSLLHGYYTFIKYIKLRYNKWDEGVIK